MKERKRAKNRNRYNQAPHSTQDTNAEATTSQLDITNESQEASPHPQQVTTRNQQTGAHESTTKTRQKQQKWSTQEAPPWNGEQKHPTGGPETVKSLTIVSLQKILWNRLKPKLQWTNASDETLKVDFMCTAKTVRDVHFNAICSTLNAQYYMFVNALCTLWTVCCNSLTARSKKSENMTQHIARRAGWSGTICSVSVMMYHSRISTVSVFLENKHSES